MKHSMLSLVLIVLLPMTGIWMADTAAAKVNFSVKGPFGTVHGNFTGLKATIRFDVKDPTGSNIVASIDVKTISTGSGLRNNDLRNKEVWFNADKFPTIVFKSIKIQKAGDGYTAYGNLTIKGTTKSMQLPFTFTSNGSSGVFKGNFHINRQDYKIGKPGGSVGDDIAVSLEVPVKK